MGYIHRGVTRPFLQGRSSLAMEAFALRSRKTLVDCLLRECMPESVTAAAARLFLDQLLLSQSLQLILDITPAEVLYEGVVERTPQHSCGAKDFGVLRGKPIHAEQDAVHECRRQSDVREGLSSPTSLTTVDIPSVHGDLEHLFEDEGVAFAASVEEVTRVLASRLVEDCAHHPTDAFWLKWLQLNEVGQPGSAPALDRR